jgi:hypothetical protein
VPKHLATQSSRMATSKVRQLAQTRDSKEALLKLGLLDGNEEGCAETHGDAELAHGDLESPADGSDKGLEGGTSRTRLARRRGGGLCRNSR